ESERLLVILPGVLQRDALGTLLNADILLLCLPGFGFGIKHFVDAQVLAANLDAPASRWKLFDAHVKLGTRLLKWASRVQTCAIQIALCHCKLPVSADLVTKSWD